MIDGSTSVWRPGGAPRDVAEHPGGAQGDGPAVTLLVSSGRGRASNGDATRGLRPGFADLDRPTVDAAANGDGRLRLYFEPQSWLGGGQLAGFVASVRVEHAGDGALEREEDGPASENGAGSYDSGPAVVLDGWLVAEATRTLGRWRDEGLTADVAISASVSASSLHSPGFAEWLITAIDGSGIPASHFVLRLPRHAFQGARDAARMSIAALHARGVGVAVDDLEAADARAAVPGLLINQLVISHSLIASLEVDPARAALVTELTSLARLLGAVPVADGVETAAQAEAAHDVGCRLARGPYIGPARPAEDVERGLRTARTQG